MTITNNTTIIITNNTTIITINNTNIIITNITNTTNNITMTTLQLRVAGSPRATIVSDGCSKITGAETQSQPKKMLRVIYYYSFKHPREKCKHFAETYSSNCLRKFFGGSSDLGELENKEQEADSRG